MPYSSARKPILLVFVILLAVLPVWHEALLSQVIIDPSVPVDGPIIDKPGLEDCPLYQEFIIEETITISNNGKDVTETADTTVGNTLHSCTKLKNSVIAHKITNDPGTTLGQGPKTIVETSRIENVCIKYCECKAERKTGTGTYPPGLTAIEAAIGNAIKSLRYPIRVSKFTYNTMDPERGTECCLKPPYTRPVGYLNFHPKRVSRLVPTFDNTVSFDRLDTTIMYTEKTKDTTYIMECRFSIAPKVTPKSRAGTITAEGKSYERTVCRGCVVTGMQIAASVTLKYTGTVKATLTTKPSSRKIDGTAVISGELISSIDVDGKYLVGLDCSTNGISGKVSHSPLSGKISVVFTFPNRKPTTHTFTKTALKGDSKSIE